MATAENIYLPSLLISGYRSFGSEAQKFSNFSKINILIGQNNCGKSNVLRFIHDRIARAKPTRALTLNELDRHMPRRCALSYGWIIPTGEALETALIAKYKWSEDHHRRRVLQTLHRLVDSKRVQDSDEFGAWVICNEHGELSIEGWEAASGVINDNDLYTAWNWLIGHNGGSREQHWLPRTVDSLASLFRPEQFNAAITPAIRQVGIRGSESEDFSGNGIIERLAKLQNPSALRQEDKIKFRNINNFLRHVTDNPTAEIEIPHERDTILVQLDERVLPLESLGSGIHEVIILASAATILENQVVCMEEPELHLNPILQKKLIRYLQEKTSNQYFITTHSASLMDTPGAEVYHIELRKGQSIVERASSDRRKSKVCEDLGYHPSDLLQTNCIIWVEGPSDRIYLKWWIKAINPQLIEGIHYSVMFYGGRLLSHLSAAEEQHFVDDFISLRRLNQRSAILIDSDKDHSHAHINATKRRIRDEFDSGSGHAWITEGREIENYIDPNTLKEAICKVHPHCTPTTSFDKYDNCLKIKTKTRPETQASKIEVAYYIASHGPAQVERFDLNKQIKRLVSFIQNSNPRLLSTDKIP